MARKQPNVPDHGSSQPPKSPPPPSPAALHAAAQLRGDALPPDPVGVATAREALLGAEAVYLTLLLAGVVAKTMGEFESRRKLRGENFAVEAPR
eukprot:gene10195-biopygen4037